MDAKKGVILLPIFSTAKLEPKILASDWFLAGVGELLVGLLLVLFAGGCAQLVIRAINAIEAKCLKFMAWIFHYK
jgi:hypothetical protein